MSLLLNHIRTKDEVESVCLEIDSLLEKTYQKGERIILPETIKGELENQRLETGNREKKC